MRTFTEVWNAAVRDHPDNTFLVFRGDDGRVTEWNYRDFDAIVARVAGTLVESGVEPGSTIHLALRNSPAFIALWLAAARIDATMVPVDPASAARDIANQVSRVRPVVGVCATTRSDVYRAGADESIPVVFDLTEDATDVSDGSPLLGDAVPSASPTPDRTLAIMFTSGTTSTPKGVVLTQACYANVAQRMAEASTLQAGHRWYVTLPLFHANAQYYCFAPAIHVGASVALTQSFSASKWVDVAAELNVTHASLFAAPIRMILARNDSHRTLGLTHVWFAQSLGAEHYDDFATLVGTRPRQLYGMTETVAIVCCDSAEKPTHDVIGLPIPGREVRIDAEDGQPGQLSVRGTPGVDLFAGYLDDEATTNKSFGTEGDETWFATGDLVRSDNGVLRFVGRVDDVIKVAGENVSLTEVEAAVAQAPGVLEAAVVAKDDPIRDKVPVAYVVPKDAAHAPELCDLDQWATKNLAPAARPRAWHIIAELPRTSVGKVRRFRIAE
ncbi:acyl--CoA ligase [Rhodococcus sp. BP-252]|uniref:class I adenylate-forming enzyme family protein n=1 Tax=unclassified Rhodococcus (in: high G+C Gram-positive bacteria) TaxID=192944 RepID=UPI001C9A5866|nr:MULTISPECIES: class I adenylate-forming enzyme family protein [unclassified Rhodococcus (in: high G+C Gram-positive bacteria)]MBY6410760.1 acyl--CoA ligase [Rhodococcus sp. BP-320]MBY6415415.1 acyl--CoA ligase [Rhodococcus sp. BP-321]MBY6420030.1 acyl--CoA ligase [Rhodococcus sp. BP-324]MBY6425316.1 acyl--CoA ligase [Rhodococcus sp. BP-323]MBY6430621.1 acyl--CoA ligase [Rhodococcus sp. BP-322]